VAGHGGATGGPELGLAGFARGGLEGSGVASFTCEAFSTRRLQEISRADIDARREFLRSISTWP